MVRRARSRQPGRFNLSRIPYSAQGVSNRVPRLAASGPRGFFHAPWTFSQVTCALDSADAIPRSKASTSWRGTQIAPVTESEAPKPEDRTEPHSDVQCPDIRFTSSRQPSWMWLDTTFEN